MEKNWCFCAGCGKDLCDIMRQEIENEKKPCPDCGSTKRNHYSEIEASVRVSTSVRYKIKDPSGIIKYDGKDRPDIWKKHNKRVRVTIDKNHTHPEHTVIRHKVEEVDESGVPFRIIHEDIKKEKAKHRPSKNK
jgi:hypothetical protein